MLVVPRLCISLLITTDFEFLTFSFEILIYIHILILLLLLILSDVVFSVLRPCLLGKAGACCHPLFMLNPQGSWRRCLIAIVCVCRRSTVGLVWIRRRCVRCLLRACPSYGGEKNVSASESESVGMSGTSGRSRGLREPSVSSVSACHIRCREDMTACRTRGWSAIGVDGLHGGRGRSF